MKRISDAFTLNGHNMPTPDRDGISISLNPLWSKNAGRTGSGRYVGDIIDEKYTIDITLTYLSDSDVAMIEEQMKNAFFEVSVIDPKAPSRRITIESYKTPRTYQLSCVKKGKATLNTVTLNFVQR